MAVSGTALMGWSTLGPGALLHWSRLISAGIVLLVAAVAVAGVPLLALGIAVAYEAMTK